MAVGLRLGAYNYRAELSKLQLQNPTDVSYGNDYSVTAPLTGFGVYLYTENFFAAVSAPRMVFVSPSTTASGINLNYISQTHYYATGGKVFDVDYDLFRQELGIVKSNEPKAEFPEENDEEFEEEKKSGSLKLKVP